MPKAENSPLPRSIIMDYLRSLPKGFLPPCELLLSLQAYIDSYNIKLPEELIPYLGFKCDWRPAGIGGPNYDVTSQQKSSQDVYKSSNGIRLPTKVFFNKPGKLVPEFFYSVSLPPPKLPALCPDRNLTIRKNIVTTLPLNPQLLCLIFDPVLSIEKFHATPPMLFASFVPEL